MLYFFECMIRAISNGLGWNVGPLSTTGKAMTYNDVFVGLLGWLIVAVIVLLIVHIVKFSKKRNKDKSTTEDSNKNEKKRANSNVLNSIIYIFECMALGILCLHSGTDRIMYSTGEKLTRKEVVTCVCSWLIVALYVLDIILIFCL